VQTQQKQFDAWLAELGKLAIGGEVTFLRPPGHGTVIELNLSGGQVKVQTPRGPLELRLQDLFPEALGQAPPNRRPGRSKETPDDPQNRPMLRRRPESRGWKHDGAGVNLAEVVARVRPTMLVGASTIPGSFTEEIVREMAAHTQRPIIFALSNPPLRAEANPADVIAWTDGRALIATGSPFSPVTYKGLTYVVAHASNAMLYPGLTLGAIVARASRISDGMFAAAANAVSSLVAVSQVGASLLPHVDDLRGVSLTVAVAVAEAAGAEGLARVKLRDIVQQVQDAMWQPDYRRIEAC
jgi:malic enzyme